MTYDTREAWLMAAVAAMQPWLRELRVATSEVRISCGYGKRAGKTAIGWCVKNDHVKDFAHSPIFISPEIEDPETVLATVLHELIHSSDNCESKHGGHFRRVALALGLEPPMTATMPGPALRPRLAQVAESLGPYPHTKIVPIEKPKVQTTRMIKITCPEEGYLVRTTKKWLEAGLPRCPWGHEMQAEENPA